MGNFIVVDNVDNFVDKMWIKYRLIILSFRKYRKDKRKVGEWNEIVLFSVERLFYLVFYLVF